MTHLVRAPIADLGTISGGGTPAKSRSEYYTGEIPWVTPKDMKSWEITTAQDKITKAAIQESATNLIPSRSILIVNRSGILKHTVPVAINRVPVAINQDLKAIVCGPKVVPEYLARMIKAAEPTILGWVRATTADNFPLENLKQLEIPLPPLPEQRRIAAILDAADALRQKRRQALRLLDQLSQAIFIEMFGDHLADGRRRPLSELVEEFRYGTSNKSGDQGYPTLRIPNVIGGGLDLEEIKLVDVEPAERDRLRLLDGDVLFVRTNGNPDYVGRCAVFDSRMVQRGGEFADEQWIFASYLIRARLRQDCLTPAFLREYLATLEGRKALRERSKTSAGQYNINTEGLSSIPIPLPPMELQQRFAEQLSRVGEARDRNHRAEKALNALFASLQHRAFRGEL